jgi:hypothetical protein
LRGDFHYLQALPEIANAEFRSGEKTTIAHKIGSDDRDFFVSIWIKANFCKSR